MGITAQLGLLSPLEKISCCDAEPRCSLLVHRLADMSRLGQHGVAAQCRLRVSIEGQPRYRQLRQAAAAGGRCIVHNGQSWQQVGRCVNLEKTTVKC